MAMPTIVFDSGAGSDTAASGAGPGDGTTGGSALTGADASTDAGGTVVTVPNADLTNVATDGSHAVWLNTASGRQFSKITAKANSGTGTANVTVANAYTGSLSGQTYAIGGKRATWDNSNSRKLFNVDILPGWTAITNTAQTLNTSALACSIAGTAAAGAITLKGSGGTPQTITQTANIDGLSVSAAFWIIQNLKLANNNATKTTGAGITSSAQICIKSCTLGDATNKLFQGLAVSAAALILDCEVTSTTDHGIVVTGSALCTVYNCFIHDGSTRGFSSTSTGAMVLDSCIVSDNTGIGIFKSGGTGTRFAVRACTIHNNGSHGVDVSTTAADSDFLLIVNCQITKNGGFGINGNASTDGIKAMVDYNNFGTGSTANTSGAGSNVTLGSNDLQVDPQYTDAIGDNYAVGGNTAGAGWPSKIANIGSNGGISKTFVDIGAAQRFESPTAGGFMSMP